MFRLSTTHIIRSTQNCNYSLRYWSYFLCSYLSPTWPEVHKTVNTALGTGHIFCNYLPPTWPEVHKTVTTALGIGHIFCSYLPPTWPEVHKTVTTTYGTGHIFCAATSLQRGQASLATL